VAGALSATLSKYERGELERVTTNSGDAYELYLRALATGFKNNPDQDPDMEAARHLLVQALRLDPEFSDAAALLSQTCTLQYFYSDSAEQAGCAKKYYERALELDPRLPEARLARGLYEIYISKSIDQAIADLDAVVQVRPNSSTAHTSLALALRRHGRFDEALSQLIRAWNLDPLNLGAGQSVFSTLQGLRRFPELVEQRHVFQRRFPYRIYGIYIGTALAEARVQQSPEPLKRALDQHGAELSTDVRTETEAVLASAEGRYLDAAKLLLKVPMDAPDRDFRLGFLYWAAGDYDESRRRFQAFLPPVEAWSRHHPPDASTLRDVALAQSMLGDHAAALASIDAARALVPEAKDAVNGPRLSFVRSIILVRAGRMAEGYAEVARLLRVPFGQPPDPFDDMLLIVKDDRHYDQIIHNPPRL
jgi:tetratricopeptide (TPR) repeat protein